MTDAVSPLAPFRNRLYLAYWLTGLMANFGWLIQMVGASWLMTSIGGSPEMVALVQTSVALPTMLFSLAAGAMADNFGRRTMILVSQSFLLVISSVLAFLSWAGWVNPWMLLCFTFLIGSGKALNNPAWQTYVTEFMPREDLPEAIAANSVGFNLARSVGPAIGGAIVASVGAFAAFAVNAVSNIGMIVVMLGRGTTASASDLPPERVGSAMLAGIRYVAMSPHLLVVMVRGAVFNFAAISVMALLPLVARDLVEGGPRTYGILLGGFGVGAVIGALAGARLRHMMSLEWLVRTGFLAFAVAVAVIATSSVAPLSILASACAGASWLLTLSTFNTTVQMTSPRWVVSRAHALYQAASFGGNALGSWVWGMLAASYGIPTSLLAAAAVLVFGAGLGLGLRLRELGPLGLDPSGRWVAPRGAADLRPRSGPILTSIEYRIAPEDIDAFLRIMAERRRSRARDGARAWSLARDMDDSEIWTERYQTPTWLDTQRFHSRRTQADAELSDRLKALHGGQAPTIRHEIERQPGRPAPDWTGLADH
ncbi:MFS transporter [Amaricoccus solimangrovi]|uniref:MFS transporter n=1 Tax=Amaricoccus solimangrovi TaxID=2589815 RepID=A0A501WJZ9_9RHOB|nr:MFS transporter [Amaricoccus solimangrovi]TPE47477.1 MFS transporter [Amaricoccus solimangrovi]